MIRPAIGERSNLLIEQQYRNAVTFLFVDVPGDDGSLRPQPQGTVFFVRHSFSGREFLYAVTARHVVEGTRSLSERAGQPYLKLNYASGASSYRVDLPSEAWWTEGGADVDVALARVTFSVAGLNFYAFSSSEFMGPNYEVGPEHMKPLGEGDDLFFVGLFLAHPGIERVLPIVRFGNVALMPHEKVYAVLDPAHPNNPTPIDAFLAEARSWGGQSGSPVVFFHTPFRYGALTPSGELYARLVGFVQGHIDVPQRVRAGGYDLGEVNVNAGIAIVIPADKIRQMLEIPGVVEEREEIVAKETHKNPGRPRADTAALPEKQEGEFERFEDLTRKLVQVPKKELDEKRKEES